MPRDSYDVLDYKFTKKSVDAVFRLHYFWKRRVEREGEAELARRMRRPWVEGRAQRGVMSKAT